MSKTRADVRILLAGHNGLFREGLKTLLEEQPGLSVVDEVLDGDEALRLAELVKPDILLIETESPDLSSLSVLRALRASSHNLRIVLLVADIKKNQAPEAFKQGVRGIILKESATNSLFKCIRAVMEGKYWIPGKGISDSPQLQEHF